MSQPSRLDSTLPEPPGSPASNLKERGWLAIIWRRYRRNVGGMVGGAILLILIGAALFAPVLTKYDPVKPNYAKVTLPPSREHLMGTDDLGRDLLTRTLYGARVSLTAGLISVGIAVGFGLPIGLASGYYRGVWDELIIMRIVDAMQAFPFLILALAMAAVLGPGLTNAMIAIGIGITPGFIRMVRSLVLQVREQDYVQAAISVGSSDLRIMFRHILPNIISPILVEVSLGMAGAIIAEASLSYLGLGSQPPQPSWGSALRFAQGYLNVAPWMAYWPGIAISLAVISFNLVGDGLRDALDPRLKDV